MGAIYKIDKSAGTKTNDGHVLPAWEIVFRVKSGFYAYKAITTDEQKMFEHLRVNDVVLFKGQLNSMFISANNGYKAGNYSKIANIYELELLGSLDSHSQRLESEPEANIEMMQDMIQKNIKKQPKDDKPKKLLGCK